MIFSQTEHRTGCHICFKVNDVRENRLEAVQLKSGGSSSFFKYSDKIVHFKMFLKIYPTD